MSSRRLLSGEPLLDTFSTECAIARIAGGQSGAADAAWARSLAEQLDPRGQRDAAIRAAARLVAETSTHATARRLESELRRYLAAAWLRERDFATPNAAASPLRVELRRIAKLTDGEGVGWRTITDVIDFT